MLFIVNIFDGWVKKYIFMVNLNILCYLLALIIFNIMYIIFYVSRETFLFSTVIKNFTFITKYGIIFSMQRFFNRIKSGSEDSSFNIICRVHQ